mmetsp:Transcript_1676/g.3652  ORF Transcript_1676/g.3652 Transcript_1676/m.3652 type:complete len:142 (-) Transcript_1676:632-1057(-)
MGHPFSWERQRPAFFEQPCRWNEPLPNLYVGGKFHSLPPQMYDDTPTSLWVHEVRLHTMANVKAIMSSQERDGEKERLFSADGNSLKLFFSFRECFVWDPEVEPSSRCSSPSNSSHETNKGSEHQQPLRNLVTPAVRTVWL